MKSAARRLLDEAGLGRHEVSILLTDDDALHQLNLRFRGIDRPTDVLSFPQDAPPGVIAPVGDGARILGDVAISVDTARVQAAAHGLALADELALLAAHGVLHLLGHDDATEEGAAQMRARQNAVLGMEVDY